MRNTSSIIVLLLLSAACESRTGPDVPGNGNGVVPGRSLAIGMDHACALTVEGDAYCWGENDLGQLGNGSTTASSAPVAVSGGHSFVEISAGLDNTCARTEGGDAYCWGAGRFGQLGNGDTIGSSVPVPVSGGIGFRYLTVGGLSFACGIDAAGEAYCWGRNSHGQLGTGDTIRSSVPVRVDAGTAELESLSAGLGSCGATPAGSVLCWGWNGAGALGTGDTEDRPTPSPIAGSVFESVSGAAIATCGIGADGETYCWGTNYYGLTGQGTTAETLIGPSPIVGGHDFIEVAVGRENSVFDVACGLTAAGLAYCWGGNPYGALGTRTPLATCSLGTTVTDFPCTGTPAPVDGGHAFEAIRASAKFACGLTPGGEIWCWGDNESGQLGTVTSESCVLNVHQIPCSRSPVRVEADLQWATEAGSS